MKPVFSVHQKVVLCGIVVLPLLYMLFLLATLPTTQYQQIPWVFLLPITVALVQILTDFRAMGPQRHHLERVVNSRSFRRLHGVMVLFLSLLFCYQLYHVTHPDKISAQWLATAIAVFVLLLGNYQVALGQPPYMALSFETPFMRRYGDLVARGYRLAGRLLFVGGLAVVGLVWLLPADYALLLIVGIVLCAYLLAFSTFWLWYVQRHVLM